MDDARVRDSPSQIKRILESFSIRDFRFLWLTGIMSMLAMTMQMVARGFLAYDLTGSGAALGIVSMAWGIPQFFLSPLGGVIADRLAKKKLAMACQAVMMCTTLFNGILITIGAIQMWHLVALGLVQGATFAFNMPARQALIPLVVGRERLANAIALSNAGGNATQIGGPAVAGILIGIPAVGVAGVFYLMAFAYFVSVASIWFVREPAAAGPKMGTSLLQEAAAGVRFIMGRKRLQKLLLTTAVVVLLSFPYQILMPLFALRVHQVGSEGLGLLSGASGIGALSGAILVAYFSSSTPKMGYQTLAGIALGLAIVLFALAPTYPLALVAVLLVGAFGNVYLALNSTLIMLGTDSSMQGRVMSVIMMNFSLVPLAALPMSVLADLYGAPITLAATGLLTAMFVALINLPGVFRSRQDLQASGPPSDVITKARA